MEAQFWHQKWDEDKIGFHQAEVNKRLRKFWPQVMASAAATEPASVFVPLCGKSLDMLWLHQQGHHVLGVELSGKAAQAFFTENHLPFQQQEEGDYTRLDGVDQAQGITLLVGDFFSLTPAQTAQCTMFYDRAALIAMPPQMRERYTAQLTRLLGTGAHGLLMTIAYDQARMQGPPFSVPDESVHHLLSTGFTIRELAHYAGPDKVGNLAERGLETLDERIYLLDRK